MTSIPTLSKHFTPKTSQPIQFLPTPKAQNKKRREASPAAAEQAAAVQLRAEAEELQRLAEVRGFIGE